MEEKQTAPGNQNSTLADVLAQFVVSMKEEQRQDAQQGLTHFIRWCGRDRSARDLTPAEMEQYAEFAGAGGDASVRLEPVRAFLSFLKEKGFTRVSLGPHLRVARRRKGPVPSARRVQGEATHLTAQGYSQLAARLEMLKEERLRVTQEIQRAAADKDFRENAPLEAARERQGRLEGLIQELAETLQRAALIDHSGQKAQAQRVRPGCTVVLLEHQGGRELSYTLVDAREADPARGKISTSSPVGKALLDKQVGNEVSITAPRGVFRFVIQRVEG